MKKFGLLLMIAFASATSIQIVPSFASQDVPKFCQKLKTAQDYKADHIVRRWDHFFPRCIGYSVGTGKSTDPALYELIYRTALQHQNGIRDDREKALDYYELLLRDQKRDWRKIVANRVDEYTNGFTSIGYPYRSSAKVLADIKQKSEEFEREVSGRKEIVIGDTGTIEIPENLSIGQKFVAIIGAAIIADIARGLSGESTPQDVQDVLNQSDEFQRELRARENSTWNHNAMASYDWKW